jgi:hypothetical protein
LQRCVNAKIIIIINIHDREVIMLKISKICFAISGFLLIADSTLMLLNKPNPLGLPLPCPITLIILGIGLILFSIAKK